MEVIQPPLSSSFHEYLRLTPDELMEIFLKYHQQNRSPSGPSEWKCGLNELRDVKDQTIVALAPTEGGNKDTLVPGRIKYGGTYTEMLMHSSPFTQRSAENFTKRCLAA